MIEENPIERTIERNGGIYKEKGINVFDSFKKYNWINYYGTENLILWIW